MKKGFKHFFVTSVLCIMTFCFVGMVILSGAGLVYNRRNYGREIGLIGFLLIISGIFTAFGFILSFSKKRKLNILSMIVSLSGAVLCMAMLYKICRHAQLAGWSSMLTSEPAESIYQRRILPVLTTVFAAIVNSLSKILKYGRKNNL